MDESDPVLRGVAAAPPLPPPEERLGKGTKLGPYEIRAFLGAGGMGAVYRAYDIRLGRDVAVKVLPEVARADPRWQVRFEREARAVAALNHPNIMALYDVGVVDGMHYLVCELLKGQTLREKLKHAPLPLGRALAIAEQVARGLAAAHEKGLVHRDLKPANIFVTQDGTVKILDFGLAKTVAFPVLPMEATVPAGAIKVEPPLETETGAVVGTPGYMAPEQIRGNPADHRADLFAYGVVLYEMLTGRKPFARETGPEVAVAIMHDEPAALSAETPRPLARVVLHCLDKDPGRRFQSALDILFALEAFGHETGATGDRAARHSRPRLLALGIGTVLVLTALAAIVVWQKRPVGGVATPTFERITFGPEYVGAGRLLGDGRSFVFVPFKGEEPAGVFLGRIGKPDVTLIFPDALLMAVSKSDELAFIHPAQRAFPVYRGTLAQMDVTGRAPRDVTERVAGADWMPDGRGLVVARGDNTRSVLEYRGKVLYETSHPIGYVRVAPSAKHVAFVEFAQPGDEGGRVGLADMEGRMRWLTPEYADVGSVAWSLDGRELFYSAGMIGTRQIHAITMTGENRMVLSGPDSLNVEDVATDGRVLVRRDSSRTYWLAHAPGSVGERNISLSEFDVVTDMSSDGRLLAMEMMGGGGRAGSVHVRPTDGGPAIRLGGGTYPRFAPDGKWVVAVSVDRRGELVLLPTGAGTARSLPAGPITERWYPTFAALDRVVSTGIEPGHARRIYIQDLIGGEPRPVSPEGFALWRWDAVAPDGRLAGALDPEGNFVLLSFSDGVARSIPELTPNDWPCGWSEDGRSLYVAVKGSPTRQIDLVDVSTGRRTAWKALGGVEIGSGPLSGGFIGLISRNGEAWVYRVMGGQSDLYLVSVPGAR